MEVVPLFDHKYEYGDVPPLTATLAEPFYIPHVALVDDGVSVIAEGWPTAPETTFVHPRLSVTVTLYEPAGNPVAV